MSDAEDWADWVGRYREMSDELVERWPDLRLVLERQKHGEWVRELIDEKRQQRVRGDLRARAQAENARTENKPLLEAVRKRRHGGMRTGEIVDELLERFGNLYDPNDGDAYEKAREALRKKINRAERDAENRNPDA